MGATDIFIAYKFIKILSTPWEKTDAYKLGIIDKDGNYLKKQRDLKTSKEKLASNIFTRLVWNVKKILRKIPLGKTTIASLATALYLIREEAEKVGADGHLVEMAFIEHVDETYGIDIREELLTEMSLIGEKNGLL